MNLQSLKLEDVVENAKSIAASSKRSILAIAGAPGSGKTTITQSIVKELGPENVVIVPMDGFHLSNTILKKWDRRSRKGAWDTFDASGYINLISRIKNQREEIILAPDFDRDIDESIGGVIEVSINTPLILLEGTFLFSEHGLWPELLPLIDHGWFVHLESSIRQQRLIQRHMKHGMDLKQATQWALSTDEANAKAVELDYKRASLYFQLI